LPEKLNGGRFDAGAPGDLQTLLRSVSTRSMFFFQQYILRPGLIGSVAPSSQALAREMLDWLELDRAQAVLEVGPGTGAFTKALLPRVRKECRVVLIELNADFVATLRRHFPGVTIYNESVANARSICDREGIAHADCIVSGLPWASFPPALQKSCLAAIAGVLRPGGQFVTFAYRGVDMLPRARRFRENLDRCFREVTTSRTVTWNLPPAAVYRCRL
jgi:phosphatidylethanolamine/phosphatidyl-N-methylethanolamine N-methyltransferase